MNMFTTKQRMLLAILGGMLMGLSFPPLPLYFLIFIAVVPYLFLIDDLKGLGEINRYTYLTAFVFNLITIYWVGSWTKEADPFLMISGGVLLFFNPILFLIPSTLFYFSTKVIKHRNLSFLLLPLFWVSYEYLYTLTDARFPWLTIGNSLSPFNTFIQIADIIGVYGTSLIILFTNISLFIILKKYFEERKIKYSFVVALILLIVVPLIYGVFKKTTFQKAQETIKMGFVQPDMNPWKKWEAGSLTEQLDLFLELSGKAIDQGAELVIWPETALPVWLLSGGYPYQVEQIHKYVDSTNVPLLTGMPDATFYPNEKAAPEGAKLTSDKKSFYTSYNSILLFKPRTKEVQKYGKIKLVPFGEKVPFSEEIPFLGDLVKWNVGISSWNTGQDTTVFMIPRGNSDTVKIGGVICIESIFPDFTSAFVKNGAELITVVTNNSWYGRSSGPYQHKEFSRFRAVENRRSLVFAANGGISLVTNPLGETIVETDLFTRDVVTTEVTLNSDLTFYTKYPLIIPVLASVVSLWIFGMFVLVKLKNKWKS